MVKISIVVPCFNEESVIEEFHQELSNTMSAQTYDYEVVYINDGSTDATLEKLKHITHQQPNLSYLSFSRNFGKESSMLAGIEYSTGDAVVILDADLQHPPTLIPQLVNKYLEGNDQVIAKRTRKGEKISRSFCTSLFYKIMNRFTDVTLEDGMGDFRLLSKKAKDALLSLKEYNRFSKGLFCWIGFKSAVIEYENVERQAGVSAWTFKKLLNYAIDGVISFNNRPLRISIYLGGTITVMGVLYILIMLIEVLVYGISVPGYFTLISSILLLSGIQLVFLGVIGEYIGRIYYESKRRPCYIIDETDYHEKNSQNHF